MAVQASSRPRAVKTSKPKTTSVFSMAARLLTWYALYTIFFVCPSPSGTSPESLHLICKSYSTIADRLSPHFSPYYEAYVAHRVDPIKSQYLVPAYEKSKVAYDTYAAEHVQTAKTSVNNIYTENVQPRLDMLQTYAGQLYSQHAAKHVNSASELSSYILHDYVSPVQVFAANAYHDTLIPTYNAARPYAISGYENTQHILLDTVLPAVQSGAGQVNGWVDRAVLPRARIMWKDSVEPQLVRIGEKMWRRRERQEVFGVVKDSGYQDHIQAIHTVDGDTPTTIKNPEATSPINATPNQMQVPSSEDTVTDAPVDPESSARATAEQDLSVWKTKFEEGGAKAARDLAERLDSISKRAILTEKSVFADKMTLLEDTISSELDLFKSRASKTIKAAYKHEKPSPQELKHADETLASLARDAGVKIRDQSAAMRARTQGFLDNVYDQASTAADTTLEVLDSVRDLGMHEIGMKWAWMEGITYRDWAQYHELKPFFKDIRDQIVDEAQDHPGLVEAERVSKESELQVNAIAAEAAEELSRLKSFARRKLNVGNLNDDEWDDSWIPEAMEKLANNAKAKISEGGTQAAVAGQEAADAIQRAQESIGSVVDAASSTIASAAGVSSQGTLESVASVVTEAARSMVSEATSTAEFAFTEATQAAEDVQEKIRLPMFAGVEAVEVFGREIKFDREPDDDEDSYSAKVKSVADKVSSAVSEAMYGTTPGTAEKVTSAAKEKYEEAWTAASNAIYGTPKPMYQEVIVDKFDEAVKAASNAIYGTPTPMAKAYAAEATNAAKAAAVAASKSYSSLAAEASTGYDNAMDYVEGRYRQAVGRINAAAGKKDRKPSDKAVEEANRLFNEGVANAKDVYSQALKKASIAAYGTPTPAVERMASQAGEYATQVTDAAEARYEELKAFVSELVIGKEPDFTESVMNRMSTLIYGTEPGLFPRATAAAGEVYENAVSAVTDAYQSVTSAVVAVTLPPAVEVILVQANEKFESALSAASIALYGTEKGTMEKATSAVGENIAAATSLVGEHVERATIAAGEAYDQAASKVSEAIYGTPTGQIQAATDAMNSAFKDAQKQIYEAIYGTEQGYFEYATSVLGETFESATSAVGETYAQATDSAASAAGVVGKAVEDSADNVKTRITEVIYGKEKTTVEQAVDSLNEAMEAAKKQLTELFYGKEPSQAEKVMSNVEEAITSATEQVKEAYKNLRDEL